LTLPGVSLKRVEEGEQINLFASDIERFSLFDFLCEDQKTIAIRDSPIDQLFDEAMYMTHFKVRLGLSYVFDSF
jgi:hypothetical protein